jgi:tetratricopeptide (TPR) repeat protein
MTARARRSGRPRSADFTTPLTIPRGAVAGADLVRELAPEVALPVWQTLRSVLLWAGEEPAMRGDLFERCAMADWERELLEDTWEPDVRCPLAVLVGELGRLAEGSPETIARACLCVTDWALEHGHVATALAFAEAAALAWPQHPRYSWMAGRLMRAHGRPREAELWLKRAERAAASLGDWEAQTLAFNSLGNVYYEMGNYPRAQRTLREALRVARRHRLRQREGEILHDLFVLSTWSGELEAAEQLARETYDIYQSGHHRLPALVHDVAVLWMMRGHFARALFVLQELPPFITAPQERARVLSMLARAAAACEQEPLFLESWSRVWEIFEDPMMRRRAAPDLIELGLGASSLGKWEMAEHALNRALDLATQTGESDVQMRAEAALEAVRARRVAEHERNPIDVRNPPTSDALATGFLTCLHETALTAAA